MFCSQVLSKFSGLGKIRVDEKKKVVAATTKNSKVATSTPTLKVKVKSSFEKMMEIQENCGSSFKEVKDPNPQFG